MRIASSRPRRPVELVARCLLTTMVACHRARRYVRGLATVGRFASRGDNLAFDPDGTYTYESIHIGHNVDLGVRPVIIAARSTVRIGDNVMFGPEVTIRGGNHRVDVVGVPMIAVRKQDGDERFDLGVTIEDDVWIGTRAVILHGVTIGRGAVVGAGSVVTRSVPPYCIAAGNPARVLRRRWSADVIAEHERALYPPDRWLTVAELSTLDASAGIKNRVTAGAHDR
jgi:acetyltransferase-like isoleucine patch superfamily enzyme